MPRLTALRRTAQQVRAVTLLRAELAIADFVRRYCAPTLPPESAAIVVPEAELRRLLEQAREALQEATRLHVAVARGRGSERWARPTPPTNHGGGR